MNASTLIRPRGARPISRGAQVPALHRASAAALLSLASLAAGCGPATKNTESTTGSGTDPSGAPVAAIVDPNEGGEASSIRVAEMRWGRLVHVYDAEDHDQDPMTPRIRTLQYRDFLIGENVISDGVNYRLETSPFTEQTELTILADADSDDVFSGTSETHAERFRRLLETAANATGFIKPTGLGPSFLPPFPLVPRNAAVSIRFTDLLDHGTVTGDTVQVYTGSPPTSAFDARVIPDPNYGALIQGGGGLVFRTTRVIVDFTVSEAESQQSLAAVNSVGVPPSLSNTLVSVAIRIPSALDPSVGQFQLLRNLSGHSVDHLNNGPVDTNSTRDVVRAFRSGRSDDDQTNQDPNNGFLLDLDSPRILGSQPIDVVSPPVQIPADPTEGDAATDIVYLASFRFVTTACALTPRQGNILRMTGSQLTNVFAEVTRVAPPPQGGLASDVRVRLLQVPAGVELATLRAEFEGASSGQFQSTFAPGSGVIPECFVGISPSPLAPPTDSISTQPQLTLRFSEPMDPTSVAPHDTFRLDRVRSTVLPGPLPSDTIIAEISAAPDLREFRYSPVTRLNHVLGSGEEYFLNVVGGAAGITDLAGNALADTLPNDIRLTLAPGQADQRTGGIVLTFDMVDEDFNGTTIDPSTPFPEVRGQILYDLTGGVLRPRAVTREARPADRTQPLYAVMTQTTGPVITPLVPLGSRMMTVWRYADVGFQILDEATSNIDVEGINWAPFGGSVSTDFFAQFEMSLAHSRRLPDEFPIPILQNNGGLAQFPNSGLNKTFDNNILGATSDKKVVHPRERGYLITPSQVFESPVSAGVRLMPYPFNRQGVAVEDFEYYTWRDTSLLGTGGGASFGADLKALETVNGLPCNGHPDPTVYEVGSVRSLALPLLMEFKCFPDDGAIGLNGLDTSFALASERLPAFRVFASGGFNKNGLPVTKNPDAIDTANGGFDPSAGGAGLPGDDNTVMIGQLDVVVRVSRLHSIWFRTGTNQLGLPDYLDPVIEPRPDAQPLGTSVVVAFRGASDVVIPEPDPMLDDPNEWLNAQKYDAYGDPLVIRTLSGPGCLNGATSFALDIDTANFVPTFFPDPSDGSWHDSIHDIDGAEYVQARVTFVSNAATGLTPELSTLAIPFLQ